MANDNDADFERRVKERARRLWESEGRPAGREDEYREKARELIAIEDNPKAATEPVEQSVARTRGDTVEPPESLENQGEFPGLADQGEESPTPPKRGR